MALYWLAGYMELTGAPERSQYQYVYSNWHILKCICTEYLHCKLCIFVRSNQNIFLFLQHTFNCISVWFKIKDWYHTAPSLLCFYKQSSDMIGFCSGFHFLRNTVYEGEGLSPGLSPIEGHYSGFSPCLWDADYSDVLQSVISVNCLYLASQM